MPPRVPARVTYKRGLVVVEEIEIAKVDSASAGQADGSHTTTAGPSAARKPRQRDMPSGDCVRPPFREQNFPSERTLRNWATAPADTPASLANC